MADRQYCVIPDHYTNIDAGKHEWMIEIHLPGVKKEEIKLRVLPDIFDLQVERADRHGYALTEYFPFEITPNSVEAKYENGLLLVRGKIKDPLEQAVQIPIS
jgi:HSP20 family molecular chaperone IbpA